MQGGLVRHLMQGGLVRHVMQGGLVRHVMQGGLVRVVHSDAQPLAGQRQLLQARYILIPMRRLPYGSHRVGTSQR